jgi:hypothetical protein
LRRPAFDAGESGCTSAIDGAFAADHLGHADSQAPALYFAELDELLHDGVRNDDRDREADADVAAGGTDDRRVDADELALEVDERAARVARIDRGVGLDEMLVAFPRQAAAAERRDDARGRRLADAERVADRDHEVADLQRVGIAELHVDQILRVHPHHGDVGSRIGADELRRQPAIVLQRHQHLARVLHHVRVGDHVALACVDDHARAGGDLRLGLARPAEEAPEERIAHQRVLLPRG